MRKILNNRLFIKCLLLLMPFVVLTATAIFGFLGGSSSISGLIDYKYFVFLVIFVLFVLAHSYYMFRRNIKWAAFSISAGIVYSLGLFLGLVVLLETITKVDFGAELSTFILCTLLMSTFFSYLLFGLAAKDYYKKPKRTSVYELLLDSSAKHFRLFLNILIPLLLVFFCTITLGPDFFWGFTSLMLLTILVSILSGALFPIVFYLICLKKLD